MPTSTAQVPAERPERYVKQLVSHLGRRRTARQDSATTGTIEWPDGACDLACVPGSLLLTATAEDADALARVQDVVARHLERFGAREGVQVSWSKPA